MQYTHILRKLAEKEGVSEQQIEAEMRAALDAAGITCPIEKVIEKAVCEIRKDYI